MSLLVKLNYGIAVFVVLLGFIASIVSYQRNNSVQLPARIPEDSKVAELAIPAAPHEADDWKYECKLSLEGMEQCSAKRSVMWENDKSEALLMVLSMSDRSGAPTPRLKLLVPLGSFLPAGVSMTIDAQEPFIVPFQACAEEGCFVNLDLAPDVVDAMRGGDLMMVEYMTPDQKIATVKIPLAGVDGVLKRIAE